MSLFLGPGPRRRQNDGIEKPRGIKDIPKYLYRKSKGFLTRLFYIIGIVWQASPPVMIVLALFCLLNGLIPVAGDLLTSRILTVIAELIGANASGSLIEDLFVTLSPVLFLFLFYVIFLFLKRVLLKLNSMVTSIAGELVVNNIKLKIIGKAKTVDQRSFDDPDFYEKLENANREATMRPIGILTASFNVISSVISVISFIIVLATLSPIAPIIIIAASLPTAFVNYYFKNRSFIYLRRHSKERRQMNYYSALMTSKDYSKEIKLLSLGDTFTEKYDNAFKKYYGGLKKIILKEGISQVVVSLIYVIATVVLFVYVAYTVVFGNGEVGDYMLYTGALGSISTAVGTLVTATATIYEGTLFIDNMMDFMKEPSTVVPSVNEPKCPAVGAPHVIELRDVSFKYPGSEKYVINHVNLTLKTGESAVLVGLNGAGKSTLIKLITRLYDPTDGVILLDGVDIREYDVDKLYSLYGIIFQDFGKYADSVEENIRFGDIDFEHTEEATKVAAERAGACDFIEALPMSYSTPLTRLFEENGIELSGGQWQKLSVARAFYKNSDILILDEPTASLDPLAESEIFNRFSELSQGKLSVFVSHRLSGAVNAGKIIVLEGGEIVEEGTHEELMGKMGRYYLLFSTQARRYTE